MNDEHNAHRISLARDLANVMAASHEGITLGITDTAECTKALRFFANCWYRRAALAAVIAALVVGLPDINGDGRVNLADLGSAARQVFGVISPTPAAALPIKG